jgi:hypothetical protein
MISSVLLAVFSAANLFAYVYWQTVSNVTHPSVVLAFNLLLALTLLYISYLVDLRPLQQRFRRWDCNIILHFAFLLASNLIALVLSAYTINLWQSNAMASIESLYAVMWKVITYRQFWTPSRWLEASAGDLLIAAATTAFYLSVVASAWRVGEFARTLDDWTALAQQKTLVGEPDRALKLLGNVHTNTEEVRRVRAAALVGVGEAEQAWREIERAVEMRLNEVDADVAFLSYLEVASEFTTSTQMAMKAFCVAVAKGISDGRVALMVGDLLGSGKFDNSIFESACTDSAKYPLARIAVNVIQGRVN